MPRPKHTKSSSVTTGLKACLDLAETLGQSKSFAYCIKMTCTGVVVCGLSLFTCLMLLMGSLIKCAAGVQLKRGIDKQSPRLSAEVN